MAGRGEGGHTGGRLVMKHDKTRRLDESWQRGTTDEDVMKHGRGAHRWKTSLVMKHVMAAVTGKKCACIEEAL